ncbi:glycoside hydrolase [Clostridium sp.]|uniref:glycoside hydrolase n=1 Tax=Clostridium sp. TaxID=1506 RepID=UPI003F386619
MKRKLLLTVVAISSLSVITGCAQNIKINNNEMVKIENKDFDFNVNPETFEIKVDVNGTIEDISKPLESTKISNLKDNGNEVSWTYDDKDIDVEVEKKDKYLDINIKSIKEEENNFSWPIVSGDAYMLPLNEGKYIKSDDDLWKEYFNESELKTLESLSMQFFAVDKKEYSIVYVIENPYNNHLIFNTEDNIEFEFNHEYPSINDKREYGFRVYITDKDPVQVAKTYKDYKVEKGDFITLEEKAKENKNIEKLYGAPHVYFWDRTIISEENIRWNELAKSMPDDLKLWMQSLLNEKVEDSSELAAAFDDISSLDYIDNYTKNRIIKALTEVLQLEDFYNKSVFTNLDKRSNELVNKGIENLNGAEIIELNKILFKSKVGNSVDPIEDWANSNTVDVINDMKNSGIDNMWIGFDDWQTGFNKPELVDEAEKLGYLIGTYDSYHSIHKPGEEEWITAKFNDTSLYEEATVTNKEGEKIEGFQGTGRKLNPTLAMPSVRERVSDIIGTGLKFNSWFLDTDATGEVYDDYSPNHITTEEEDIMARKERIKYIQDEWNMVVGSEGGNDFASDVISFAHGIETPSFTWMDKDMKSNKESEYYVGRYYSPTGGVPEIFSKQIPLKDKYRALFLDQAYTIPLYKLVYNDSVITTHWWGFGTLKFKDDIKDRMLYEVLYNVPPLYHIDKNQWKEHKELITNHTKVWSEFSKKAINKEMTDYKILSDDKLVQMTKYGEDLIVIANFSNEEVNIDGNNIKGKSLLIIEGNEKIEYLP